MVQRAGTVVEPVDAVWTCNPQFISIIPLSLYKQIEWRRQAAGQLEKFPYGSPYNRRVKDSAAFIGARQL